MCQPLFPLPSRMSLDFARKFIKQNMLGKSFEEMMKEKKVADFLSGELHGKYVVFISFDLIQ